ncbi:CsiV family protein [Shewanella colwelliana]|uniref:CsiV family protein n=1 Tax=Shewanella colwelliana TaxID=23 RepID=UPI003D07DC27
MFKKRILLVIALLSLPFISQANEERWFEVEVYLFERQGTPFEEVVDHVTRHQQRQAVDMISPLFSTDITGASLGLEGCSAQAWLETPELCNQQLSSVQVSHPSHIPFAIGATEETYAQPGESTVLLSQSQAKLGDIIAKLSRERGHKSLLHMTWQQSMLPRHRAKPVHLFAGDDFSSRYTQAGHIANQVNDTVIPQFDFSSALSTKAAVPPIWQVDGAIKIYLDHYLYVESAIKLREEGSKQVPMQEDYSTAVIEQAQTTPMPFLYSIWMSQNKRVKSDEIHYFDHPNMGMILQIRKMKQPSEMAAAESMVSQ